MQSTNPSRPQKRIALAAFALLTISFSTLALNSQSNEAQNENNQIPVDTNEQLVAPEQAQEAISTPNAVQFNVLSAQSWMQRLADIVSDASYEISFVVSSPQRETMPYIWRRATLDSGDVAEQLSLLNGPGFEQIRVNNKVSIFEPGFTPISIRSLVIDGPIPAAFIHHPDILNNGYDVLLMGRNRVTGRMAQQIRVISKDKSRYQYHLWLDEQTGLLLKLNMYDLKGALLEQIQVTQFAINNEIKNTFANLQVEQLPPIAMTPVASEQPLKWTVSYRPIGMQTVAQNLRRISGTGQPAEYLMLSDGLVDVSIYVTETSDSSQEDVSISTNGTSIVSLSDPDGRLQVSVVGEIPLETANKIANSIVLKEQ
jgi:sigma-E factor negative regulatory protein RseB